MVWINYWSGLTIERERERERGYISGEQGGNSKNIKQQEKNFFTSELSHTFNRQFHYKVKYCDLNHKSHQVSSFNLCMQEE